MWDVPDGIDDNLAISMAIAGTGALVPMFRTHTCVGTGQRTPEDRHAIWKRLLALAQAENITVDYTTHTLDRAAEAWEAQKSSPHAKVVATIAT